MTELRVYLPIYDLQPQFAAISVRQLVLEGIHP